MSGGGQGSRGIRELRVMTGSLFQDVLVSDRLLDETTCDFFG